MSLKLSYTLLAPIYDYIVGNDEFNKARIKSINLLPGTQDKNILINGIGSGLDIPYLPNNTHYTGSDITPAMLARAKQRAEKYGVDIELIQADSMTLPFPNEHFDIILMHLILAVVPDNKKAFSEACRTLKPGGKIHIIDKFLKQGEFAPLRKVLNIFTRHIATRTDVIFEDILAERNDIVVVSDEPLFANGWFRLIVLEKNL